MKNNYPLSLLMFSLFCTSCSLHPQATTPNPYGLQVISNKKTYRQIIDSLPSHAMVNVAKYLHPLYTQLVYATPNNFTRQILYHQPKTYLRLQAAKALQQVQDTLHTLGLDIKIWDAYRPYAVTEKMWQIVPDDRYAANPAKGSGHNRGAAVDVTLVDAKTGAELTMPTAFDNFTDTAHHGFAGIPKQAAEHSALLKKTMEQYGFVALQTEWWHYSLPNAKQYALLNFNFAQMKQLVK